MVSQKSMTDISVFGTKTCNETEKCLRYVQD
jgi:hypothetical protein